MEKRIITTEFADEDIRIENKLRPTRLRDYIGQKKIRETLFFESESRRISMTAVTYEQIRHLVEQRKNLKATAASH